MRPVLIDGERGLSPRVRGSRGTERGAKGLRGSIPACAGEPPARECPRSGTGVYPRVCGGSPADRLAAHRYTGSIPACAGEPCSPTWRTGVERVYPRVCGGACVRASSKFTRRGLSPRVRGSPDLDGARDTAQGSIPACAGEPGSSGCRTATSRVYPRVCGGACTLARVVVPVPGLSPRVRGSPGGLLRGGRLPGSIPACAGEPGTGSESIVREAVYPRVCGGAEPTPEPSDNPRGLSPRVRGSPRPRSGVSSSSGSIPACAGEPGGYDDEEKTLQVYPRVCGGAPWMPPTFVSDTGLSPRVRGSPDEVLRVERGAGSIPACAGGALHRACASWSGSGLSPRVRGSPGGVGVGGGGPRSIPACAGEPVAIGGRPAPLWVYPRVCGGAHGSPFGLTVMPGLSPRVRGSPRGRSRHCAPTRSIPACAGEP